MVRILLVKPTIFGANPETKGSNAFQKELTHGQDHNLQPEALKEWEGLKSALEKHGIEVLAFDQTCQSPDAVFANNWISTESDGTVALYPLESVIRRTEISMEIVNSLKPKRIIDLRTKIPEGHYLESTGSVILDKENQKAFAALSSRTHPEALKIFADELDYKVVSFTAKDKRHIPIYHTNVMMSIGDGKALVCMDAIEEADTVKKALYPLQIIPFSLDQLDNFVGNALFIKGVWFMSSTAFDSLTGKQKQQLGKIEAIPLQTLEANGGGSVRCCLTQIHF